MQIQNVTFSPNKPVRRYTPRTKPLPFDSFSFTGSKPSDSAQKYAGKMKVLGFFIPQNFADYNLNKLEGIQNGIKIFEGLNMKEIAFIFENLHGVAIKRGCTNKCLHCYAGAKPPEQEHDNFITRMPYEKFVELTDGIKELKKRLGITPTVYAGEGYTDIYYDADCMEISLFDKNGREHDYTELIDKFYDATDCKAVFDTAGWNPKSPKMQKRAEKYVDYLLDLDSQKKIFQINLSMSPFNVIYAKALELGFDPKNYKPSSEPVETNNKGERLYGIYINRMANMLFTFTPLLGESNFSIITRPVSNSETNMKNFTEDDFRLIKKHVIETLNLKYLADAGGDKKYVRWQHQIPYKLVRYSQMMDPYDFDLIPAGRFKELYLKRNPEMSELDMENKFKNIKRFKEAFEDLKENKDFSRLGVKYFKIIDADGRVYLYDTFRFIPTELSLNIGLEDKITPEFTPRTEDFVITREMINK